MRIEPSFFLEQLRVHGIDFFTGVPDSLLKSFCACITDYCDARNHVIAANEGAAVGIAAGHYLATGRPACVYMQNSGEGNAINPLASLSAPEVYNIPMLLLIGWRGQPGVHDEPQHRKQGKVTIALLETMGIGYDILSKDKNQASEQIAKAAQEMKRKEVYALVVEKDTFNEYTQPQAPKSDLTISREEAIRAVAAALEENDCIVSSTGMISRELFEYRAAAGQGHDRDFLTVGSMGYASQIALGIALAQPGRRVWCFDGDGALIMHMGGLAIIAGKAPKNLVHVVFNNGAHDSVGGQPTVGLSMDLPALAKSVGYSCSFCVDCEKSLAAVLEKAKTLHGPLMIEIRVKLGHRNDLGRPTITPAQNKDAFMDFLSRMSGQRSPWMQWDK